MSNSFVLSIKIQYAPTSFKAAFPWDKGFRHVFQQSTKAIPEDQLYALCLGIWFRLFIYLAKLGRCGIERRQLLGNIDQFIS